VVPTGQSSTSSKFNFPACAGDKLKLSARSRLAAANYEGLTFNRLGSYRDDSKQFLARSSTCTENSHVSISSDVKC
jgi:hypothetical protein